MKKISRWTCVRIRFCLLFSVVTCSLGSLWAAPVTAVPYENSFEDPDEVTEWQFAAVPPNVFNPSSSVLTRWTVGNQTALSGGNSLYVVDNTDNFGYEAGSYTICAYRTFQLPQGQYDISFDWKAGGSSSEGLYVAWVPAETAVTGSQIGASVPTFVTGNELQNCRETKEYGTAVSRTFPLYGQTAYTNLSASFIVDAAHASAGYNLVFVWLVNNSGATPTAVSAAIDNIYITQKPVTGSCFYTPGNLTYSNDNGYVRFDWTGNATSYDIQFFSASESISYHIEQNITVTSFRCALSDLAEGVYTFRVRATCADGSSQWVTYPNVLIYDPSAHCLDYLNFYASGVECRYGTWDRPSDVSGSSGSVGVVDDGYASESSRHTRHYIEGETDPRTENMLTTKPAGAVASVRLGNWDTGAEWESITYTMTLSEDVGVLQLKYALVLQDPGHSADEQPRFTLEILNSAGQPVDATCGAADFRAGINTTGWHTVGTGYDKVLWKDWTTVGLNVRELRGETIKIRLTTYDCSQTAHYGYAYFTLDCSRGEIQGVTCGEKPTVLTVDEGFQYRWYKPYNPSEPFYEGQDPASREMIIAPTDSNHYACDLISLTNSDCYFTLQASALARFPKARASFVYTAEDCENYIEIKNESAIFGYHTDPFTGREIETRMGDCYAHVWSLVDDNGVATEFSREKDPARLHVSKDGGTVHIRLHVTMQGETCQDDEDFFVSYPKIGETRAETDVYMCKGGVYEFEGNTYREPGTYPVVLKTWAGCDSILTLNLHVLAADTLRDTVVVCGGQTYEWEGQDITAEGEYVHRIPFLTRVTDCDSIVWYRYVKVLDNLEATLHDIPAEICGNDATLPVTVYINKGMAGYYSLLFDEVGHNGGFTDIIEESVDDKARELTINIPIGGNDKAYKRPNRYTANLVMSDVNKCSDANLPISFDVLYPDTVLLQLWDDLLSVTNSDWNGGYEFSAYQWYKNGEMLPGQTQFRLYLPAEKLDLSAEYSVLLTRADDGISMMTCGFRPHAMTESEKGSIVISFQSVSDDGQEVMMETSRKANVQVYSSLGLLVASRQMEGKGTIRLPRLQGLYVVCVTDLQGQKETYRLILR